MIRYLKTSVFVLSACFFLCTASASTIVRMETNVGNIDIELHSDEAPITVQNFLNYVNDGDYNNTLIHRSLQGYIIQGGGYGYSPSAEPSSSQFSNIPVDDPIINEFNLTNARGTIAMAKLSSNPDSATSQWFFNTRDNNTGTAEEFNLDIQNSGFTVFGTVINGMEVVDQINAYQIWNASQFHFALGSIPLIAYVPDGRTFDNDVVLIEQAYVLEQEFQINSGLNGAWYNPETNGSGILFEILPTSNLAFMAWFTWDTELPDSELTSVIGNPGQRWLTGLGAIDHETKTITFDLTNTSGGLFDNGLDVENSEAGTVGSMVLSFSDCENATLTYLINDPELINTRSLVRITSENTALCQQLSGTVVTQ